MTGLAALEIDRLNRMFEAAFPSDAVSSHAWVPPVDILETADKDIVVRIDLPDVKREDIKVNFENDVLTVEGERLLTVDEDKGQYHRVERGHGKFRRSFTMPSAVDASRIAADYRDGLLTITLPRREESRPRQIQIG
jgi:HSP20 family protein